MFKKLVVGFSCIFITNKSCLFKHFNHSRNLILALHGAARAACTSISLMFKCPEIYSKYAEIDQKGTPCTATCLDEMSKYGLKSREILISPGLPSALLRRANMDENPEKYL